MNSDKGLHNATRDALDVPAPGTNGGNGHGGEPEQLDLLGLPKIRTAEGTEVTPRPRGPGRPPGAANKLTVAWREYLLRRYPSPLEGLVAMGAMGVDELARSLHCSPLEAAALKVRCLEYSTAFLYPRLQATLFRRQGDINGEDAATLILTEQEFSELAPGDLPPGDVPPGEPR